MVPKPFGGRPVDLPIENIYNHCLKKKAVCLYNVLLPKLQRRKV
jgi:hypothetical protein